MIQLITDISRYLMLLIMLIYTVLNFLALQKREKDRELRLCRKQMVFMVMFMVLGYLILLLRTQELRCGIIFLIQLVFFPIYERIFLKLYRRASAVILSNSLFLFALGVMVIYRLDPDKAEKQLMIGIAALLMTLLVPVIISRLKAISAWAWLYAIVGLGLLAVVWKLGSTTYGAQLTLKLGPIALQPSEFVKLTFVFFTASMFRKNQSFRQALITTVVAAAHVLVLVASTDLGSGLVYFVSYLVMIYVATHKAGYAAAGTAAGAAAAVGAYYIFDHVKVRVQMWKDPFVDYDRKGYQLAQSLFAISSGGWLGLGFCQGYPGSIPLARNDFIFAAICEEFGILFAICIILLYLGFILQLMRVSLKIEGTFYRVMAAGFAAMIGVQVFLHIGGVTKMIPSTGITLPLISYGGSSVLSTMLLIGVIQGLNINRSREDEAQAAQKELERREQELTLVAAGRRGGDPYAEKD